MKYIPIIILFTLTTTTFIVGIDEKIGTDGYVEVNLNDGENYDLLILCPSEFEEALIH